MDKEWYYRTRQRDHGPISVKELRRLIDNGLILPDTLIRRTPSGRWIRASELDGVEQRSGGLEQTSDATHLGAAGTSPRTFESRSSHLDESQPGKPWLMMISGSIAAIALVATVFLAFKFNQSEEPSTSPSEASTSIPQPVETAINDVSPPTDGDQSVTETIAPPAVSSVKDSSLKLLTTEEVVSQSEGSVALIKGRLSSGTGFLVTPTLMVTNKHVVSEELISDLKVHFPSAPEGSRGPFSAKLLYEDESLDLAFLHVESKLPGLPLAGTYRFRRGQEVIVIGNPGLHGDVVLQNAVSKGVMSTETTIRGQSYYQLGIAINSGNSGGPVFDSYGQVIGVVTLKASRKEGLGFCIPSSQLSKAIEKSQAMSAQEVEVAESMHRIRTVFTLTVTMGQEYKSGMDFLSKAMQSSLAKGGTADAGMRGVQEKVHERLAEYDQILLSALKSAVSKISRDVNLPNPLREKFVELWTNYTELKSYVDNPRGNYTSYQAKYLELSDKHDRLTESLKLLLGVEATE